MNVDKWSADGDEYLQREKERKERSGFGAHSKFWGQHQRWVNLVAEQRKQRQQQ